MTPQDQQIAIALACGYRWYWTTDGLTKDGNAFKWKANLCYPPSEGIGEAWLGCAGESREMTPEEIAEVTRTEAFYTYAPRYLESLDAMHEAEKAIQCGYFRAYTVALYDLVNRAHPQSTHDELYYDMIHASATQRAEAFLRCTGLWVDNALPPHPSV